MQVQLGTQSYQSRSLPLDGQRCVNMFAEIEPPQAKTGNTRFAVFGSAGLSLFATCGAGPVRGLHVMNDVLYAISGNHVYSIDENGNPTQLPGAQVLGSAPTDQEDNGQQICIVTGANSPGYIVQKGTVAQIEADGFYPADTVQFFDGYFVLNRSGTNEFFLSGLNDGTTFNALDFASTTATAANLKSVLVDHEQLVLFTENSTEFWYDSGALDFPFARYTGAMLQRGILAPLTRLREDNSIFFLADDYIFYRISGYIPVRVSTHAVEHIWQGYSTVSDAVAFSYTQEGHKIIIINFPTAQATWAFDISTGLWHERESWDANNVSLGRWRGNCFAAAYGKLLVGDAYTGEIGMLDLDTYTEYGNTIRGLVTSPPIHGDRKRIFMSRFELDVESGIGLNLGQGLNPQIMLDWSDDGGRTYSTTQPWQSMGVVGAYLQRLRWLRMGQARQRILRLTVTDPVRRSFIGAYLDLEKGM